METFKWKARPKMHKRPHTLTDWEKYFVVKFLRMLSDKEICLLMGISRRVRILATSAQLF